MESKNAEALRAGCFLFFFFPLPPWCSFDFGRAVCMPTLWQGWRELQKQPAGCSVPEAAAGERLGPQQPVQGTFWETQKPGQLWVCGSGHGQGAASSRVFPEGLKIQVASVVLLACQSHANRICASMPGEASRREAAATAALPSQQNAQGFYPAAEQDEDSV